MRTQAWQRKQLQTQLASWSELRHDTILYAKQSFTMVPSCKYPSVYVEPYPEFYAKLASLADMAGRRIAVANYATTALRAKAGNEKNIQLQPINFVNGM